mgnify:CR=1 FL=1
MFTNENSADAVYGSLDEARWSMECDENGNVLSIWWNEGTCHLMGYDYDKEHFQTLTPFTHLHDKRGIWTTSIIFYNFYKHNITILYYTKRNIRYYYKKRIKIKRHEPKIIS